METPSSLVVSDAHLGAAPPANERAFRDFLDFAGTATRDLLINGDLFDFWFEYGTVLPRRHFRTLRALSDLTDAGVRIRLLGGNHDFWIGSFLRDEIGIELIHGPEVMDLGGRKAYVAHGDGLGGGDWGYRLLRAVVRSRPARAAFRQLHPDWADALVRIVSRTEHREPGVADDRSRQRAGRLRTHAEAVLAADPDIQLVVFGHCHVPELREVAPGRHYLNTGDWVHHCTWAEVGPQGVTLNRWNHG